MHAPTSKLFSSLCPALTVVLSLFCACSTPASCAVSIKDATGQVVTISRKPLRIVSLAPSNTEILFKLGLGSRVVGVTRYCDYPKAARTKAVVGDMSISLEKILVLKPDLVLAHATLDAAILPSLRKAGISVYAVDPKTIAQTVADIRNIGLFCARPKTADTIADKMQQEIKVLRAQSAKKTSLRVLVVIQPDPLWAAGPGTFVDELLHILNARNVAYDARKGFVPFSKELAVSRMPDAIVVANAADRQFFLTSPQWRDTPAAKRKHVFIVDSDLLVRAGPRLTQGAKKLRAHLSF